MSAAFHFFATRDPVSAAKLLRDKYLSGSDRDLSTDDFRSVLSALPFTTKADLIEFGNTMSSACLRSGLLFSETSGSTGHPLQTTRNSIDLTWNTLNQTVAYKHRLQPGIDRVAILHPGLLSPFLEASAQALKNLNVGHLRIFPIEGVCDYKRIYEVLCRYEITTVMTTPSLAYKILYQLRKFGPLDGLFLNKLLLTGELITSVNILNFKKVLGCDALVVPFVYGGSETASLMIGRDDGRYNPILEDFIFEIPNGKIDRSISHVSKVLGELVVTWLREGVLPIRRYKTGDYFSATYNENTNEYIFEPLGRMSHTPDEIATANEVENILYGIKEMVWNYAVVASVQLRQINIELTVDSISVESNEAIREKLVSLFGRDYEVRLNINKETDKFLEFAAIPKTSKFSYI